MARILKSDVESKISSLNSSLPQPSQIHKREIKADYWAYGGGWKFYYYNEMSYGREMNAHRYNHREAMAFLRGIEIFLSIH